MMEGPRLTEFGAVFFELMWEKGIQGGLDEFVALAEEAGHEITVEEFDALVYESYEDDAVLLRSGLGVPIREVLGLDEEEEQCLFKSLVALVESYDPPPVLPADVN